MRLVAIRSGFGMAVANGLYGAVSKLSGSEAGDRWTWGGYGMTQYSSSSANTEGHVVVKERASAARLNPGGVSEGSTAVRTTASWAAGERRRGGAGKLACVVRQRTARDQECRQSWGDATQGWMWICSGPSVTNWSHLVLQGCRSGGGGTQKAQKGTELVVIIGGSRLAIGPLLLW